MLSLARQKTILFGLGVQRNNLIQLSAALDTADLGDEYAADVAEARKKIDELLKPVGGILARLKHKVETLEAPRA